MTLLDRLLFWTAERRGFQVIEPPGESVPVPPSSSTLTPELVTAKYLLQRKLEHVDAMAESFGLRLPQKGDDSYVDFR